jgi:hypothetical protein
VIQTAWSHGPTILKPPVLGTAVLAFANRVKKLGNLKI